jgi:hypothetical protein
MHKNYKKDFMARVNGNQRVDGHVAIPPHLLSGLLIE